LAQDFSVRYPLIDGQGNFGSRDGDGAAAMRYTEARLTPFASLLLSELDEGTVEFGPNYDGSFEEPLRLPARLPICLLNGASGIAVGMATEIPPHNLREVAQAAVALMEKPSLSLSELLQVLPGPDFPGGGQLISSAQEIEAAYASGRGSLKMRARWTSEELARGQWQLVVFELPHGVSSQRVLEEIEELTNPKIKAGKKSLSPDQQQVKQLVLGQLESVRDESGKDAAVRLVFEPRSSRLDRDEFARLLLAHTSLESSVSLNLVAVDGSGRPRSLSLLEMLQGWVDFRVETVRKRSQFRLGQAERRIHILEGRSIALLRIDEVIAVIRESEEPKPALMQEFGLSDLQAEDILEIRLRQLARLEAIKIERELSELRDKADKLRHLLDNERALRKAVSKEIADDAKTYGDDRRTLMKEESRTTLEIPVVDEPVTVVVSTNGWVRARQGHGHESSSFTFKTGDALYATFECRTTDALVALSSSGRAYSVAVSQLPGGRGDGAPLSSMIELETGSQLVHFVAGPPTQSLLIATRAGLGFVTRLDGMVGRNRSGKQFVGLEPGDSIALLRAIPQDRASLAILSRKGRLLVCGLDEVKVLGNGGRGVALMELEGSDDVLVDAVMVGSLGLCVSGEGRGGKEARATLRPQEISDYVSKRARKGKLLDLRLKPRAIEALEKPL
jgi:topoisomerase-4 subunit A